MIDKQFFSLPRTIAIAVTVAGVSNSPVWPAKAVPTQGPSALSKVIKAKPEPVSVSSLVLASPRPDPLNPAKPLLFKEKTVQT
ncbi:MAG: hypothetical protein AB1589_40920, partial [Cyanobacteriota bacterium]